MITVDIVDDEEDQLDESSVLFRAASLREHLNNIRQRVGTISAVGDWHAHTAFVNPAGDIVRTIRRRFHPELCTRAFCKFYELLSHYPQLVPTDRSKTSQFRSLHLCEAPGAFISALNQFIVSHRHNRFGWQWLATTLNPYNEANNRNDMLTDDSLIFGTIDRWHFGDDDTGDLLMFSREYMLKLRSTDGFDLVTADGSTSCIDFPRNQEIATFPLQFCETVCALTVLRIGGSLVLKKFTTFEIGSIRLISMLAGCFRRVSLMKPSTSKPGNSEIYVVCIDYHGIDSTILNRLFTVYGNNNVSALTDSLPHSSLHLLKSISYSTQLFANHQIATILSNLSSFGSIDDNIKEHIKSMKADFAEYYIRSYKIVAIPIHRRLISQSNHNHIPWFGAQFNRQYRKAMDVDGDDYLYISIDRNRWSVSKLETIDIYRWPVFGRQPTTVTNSLVCNNQLLSMANERQLDLNGIIDVNGGKAIRSVSFANDGGLNVTAAIAKIDWLILLADLFDNTSHRSCSTTINITNCTTLMSRFSVNIISALMLIYNNGSFQCTSNHNCCYFRASQPISYLSYEHVQICQRLAEYFRQLAKNSLRNTQQLLQFLPISSIADQQLHSAISTINNNHLMYKLYNYT